MLYSEKIMDHFINPRNAGIIEDADGVGESGGGSCGDLMKIYIKVRDDSIDDVKFSTFGCTSAIASSSMVTELVKGKKLSDALLITGNDISDALDGLPEDKMHCGRLAEEAVRSAVRDYYDKNGISYDPKIFAKEIENSSIIEI